MSEKSPEILAMKVVAEFVAAQESGSSRTLHSFVAEAIRTDRQSQATVWPTDEEVESYIMSEPTNMHYDAGFRDAIEWTREFVESKRGDGK